MPLWYSRGVRAYAPQEEQSMVIKHASRKDIAALTAVETACFPPAEAATEKEFIDRV